HSATTHISDLAALGYEHLVARRVIDDADDHFAIMGQRDRHTVEGEAMDEVRRPVNRVDNPYILGLLRFLYRYPPCEALFAKEGMRREVGADQVADHLLGALVHLSDEIAVRLLVLQLIEVAQLALDPLAGLGRGIRSYRRE